ncbi:MAG: tetraacyldisaccharide 4'-kinase [Planctomycetota bacterium]|jgi:tetraacyldisaccharide 4'-kinase
MDDGFQHRRLQRDLDIVTIDATRPFGCGRLLPAGLLREPLTALKRADAVVITRCDQASESELTKIEKTLHQIKSALTIARSSHAAVCAKSVDNRQIPLEELKDKRIFAFCGIANPDAFFRTTRNLETDLLGSLAYNDHHRYTDNDISDIREKARALNADLILTTEKDFTRITVLRRAKNGIPFACLVIEVKFLAGEDGLRRLIEHTLAGKIQQQ